ncbi:MAG: tape measure protein [Selenomonas sp.]|uniref:tape measure protein n=1 Tax=Selenomonas sp. TaxID=2053611 RepID=UPI0025D20093|nr:tape measure protein [Selenomonas sp.]MCR5440260.1 tape measure protein [Selenomonas sp.]
MADHNISISITANSNGVTQAVNTAQKSMQQLGNTKVNGGQFSQISAGASKATTQINRTKSASSGLSSALSKMKGAIAGAFAVGSVLSFGKAALKAHANMELLRKGLEFTLGAADTTKLIDGIKQIGEASAYDTDQLIPMARKWINVGDSADTALSKMKKIVDLGSAFGSTTDEVDRINTALAQMQMKGKISAEEMLQLSDANVPAWQLLSAQMQIPIDQLQDMASKGQLAQNAIDALFAGMEAKTKGASASLAQTLMAKFSNLEETIRNSMEKVGYIISNAFDVPGVLDAFGDMAEGIKGHVENIAGAIEDGKRPLQAICNEIENISPTAGKVANTVVAAWDKMKEAFENVKEKIDDNATAMNEIEYWGTKLAEAALAVYALEKAWVAVKIAIDGARWAQEAFWLFCKRTPWGIAAAIITAGLLAVIDNWDKMADTVEWVKNVILQACSEAYAAISEKITGAINSAKQAWEDLKQACAHPLDFIVNRTENIQRNYSGYNGDDYDTNTEAKGGINGGPIRFATGGVVGGEIPMLANGGQAKKGVNAIVGEAGPEAVIPLRDNILAKIGAAMAKAYGQRQALAALGGKQRTPEEIEKDRQTAQLDAEDLLRELKQGITDETGTNYQSSLAQIAKEIGEKQNQITGFEKMGANPETIRQLRAEAEEYSKVLTDKVIKNQRNALADFAANAQMTFAQATNDYEAQANAQYAITKNQLKKEREEKEKALMIDENDFAMREAIAQEYYAKLQIAERERIKAIKAAHDKAVQAMQDEGNYAGILADYEVNKAKWAADARIESMKNFSKVVVDNCKELSKTINDYAMDLAANMRSHMADALTDFIEGTKSAQQTFSNFAKAVMKDIAKMAAQRLASSWFDGIAGIFTHRANGGVVKRAGGGYVSGPGTGKSDSIPAMLSNGEYVMTAAATKKYGAILDQMNAGRYAGGGLVVPTIAAGNTTHIPVTPSKSSAQGGCVVNITNKTDSNVSVQESRFDEDLGRWVLDVVVDGATRNRGGFGSNLRTALGY